MPFTAAPHHDILVLLVQISVLLFSARAMGEVAQRLGQPSVVGEILAGIVLGPSLLSGLFPALSAWIVPHSALGGYLIEVISLIGALFLLLITGLETDLALIRRHARTAMGVSLGGILITFSSGFALGWLLPDDLLAQPGTDQRLIFALFVATAMSISAIPVIAKVLMDMNLMRRDIGQTIIAAGMSDDTIGWVLLSIVAGLAASGTVDAGSVLRSVGAVAAFMLVSFTIGRWLVKRALDFVQDEVRSADRLVTLIVVLTLAWGAVTQALGLEAVLGAFVMGILFGQIPRVPEAVHHKLITVSLAIFTPIFFAVAGLKVNARALLEPRLLLITLLVIAVASGGKVAGTYLGARLIGRREHWTALSFGAGLNARGAMEIIIATIGLELGILSPDMFSIIVVMAMATSLMAPPALRWVLARVTPEEQELERLRQEELAAESVVAKIHRVLLPVRRRATGDAVHTIESYIIRRMRQKNPLSLTLFNVTEPGGKAKSTDFLERLSRRFPDVELTPKVVEDRKPAGRILDESQKDYDLLILGATEKAAQTDALFHPIVDRMVRLAPCPTMIVKGDVNESQWPPKRILVPTNGTRAARHAAEVAFLLAGAEDEEVLLLNVIQRQSHPYLLGTRDHSRRRETETAEQIVKELQELAESQGVHTVGMVKTGTDAETVVLSLAHAESVDLIVLGTDVRPGSDRLFLGPRVERILAAAPCPVLVMNRG
jgi:Kef-type K+ transport system membrane component KefB/nucleotide-binding universal stress UspA family protein